MKKSLVGRINWRSLYMILFVLFLFLIIPIQGISFSISQWGKIEMQNQVKATAASNCMFLMSNFELEIRNTESQLNLLINGTDVTLEKFYVENKSYSDSEYWMALRNIITRIKSLTYNNKFISEIVVYYPTLGLSVSSINGVTKLDMQDYIKTAEAYYRYKAPMTDAGKSIFISKSFPAASVKDGGTPTDIAIMVKANLAKNEVAKYLSTFSVHGGFPTILINRNANTRIIDSETERLLSREGSKSLLPALLSDSNVEGTSREGYYLSSAHSDYLNCSVVQYVPISELFRIPNRYSMYSLLMILLTIPILMLYSVLIYRLVKYPINGLVEAFHRIRDGDLDVKLDIKTPSIEFHYLIDDFNKMVIRLKDLIDKIYKQEIYTQQIELKQLQAQINPHFLYNSFFTLSHLIKDEDMENASRLAEYLGSCFQYITRNGELNVTLQSEYENARTYLQIQQIRFENRLNVEISDLPERFRSIFVPRMILQPLLENTLEHGVKTRVGEGRVRIRIIEDDVALHIFVDDNGDMLEEETLLRLQRQLRGDEPITETTAVFNIHKRLQLFFGKDCGLSVSRSELGGLAVDLKIRHSRLDARHLEKRDQDIGL